MVEERAKWGRQVEFVLTLIGYAVGLGNVWRFPYLCYQSGGGAFLIPYTISLIFLGIPMFAMECALGQFGGQGPVTVWGINPAAKGIGISAVVMSAIVTIYYSVVIAWALRFFIASLTDHLPWEDCESCQCLLYQQKYINTALYDDIEDPMLLQTKYNVSMMDNNNQTIPFLKDLLVNNSYGLTCKWNVPNVTKEYMANNRSRSEVFFWDRVLENTGSIEESGELQWELLLCNLACFVIVFLVLLKGISSLGKVVYFTATFPYILLTILLVRGVTLEGAGTGVRYYLEPDWSRLSDAKVWSDAAIQIFFSLSACMGGLIAMASYNNFNNNVIRDAFVVPIVNCLTSFFAGFVVFSTLGHMAHQKNVTVDKVTAQGPGLVFVVYPEAISQMPVSPLWAILFFFMVCILGFSTQFSAVETVMCSIEDQFPAKFKSRKNRIIMRAMVCIVTFALGIPMVTGSGQYLLGLIDSAVLGYPLLLVGLFECIVVVGVYGYDNFIDDLISMVGTSHRIAIYYFGLCWRLVTPVLLCGVIIFKAYQEKGQEPDWANLIYWLTIAFPIAIVPGWWFYEVCTKSELTHYTPAWRERRLTGTKKANTEEEEEEGTAGDTEPDVSAANSDTQAASEKKMTMAIIMETSYDNPAYINHTEIEDAVNGVRM